MSWRAILDNELTDQADASRYLVSALPPKVVSTCRRFTHPLKANIIATQINNAIINLMGHLSQYRSERERPYLPDVINAVVASFHETGVLDILPTLGPVKPPLQARDAEQTQ